VTLLLLVKAATQEPIILILDWWYLSTRVRNIEQSIIGLQGHHLGSVVDISSLTAEAERIRRELWHGQAVRALSTISALGETLQSFFTEHGPAYHKRIV